MPEDTTSRTVKVGEDRLTIQPFRGYKAVKAGQIIAEAMGSYQEIIDAMEDFRKAYAERHKITITRSMARVRQMDLPDKAFDADGNLELPGEPSQQVMIGVVFPRIMQVADRQLFDLLALALTPNGELSRAYENGDELDEAVKPQRRKLLFEAELPQLIELTGKVIDLLRGELTGLGEQVGKMRDLVMGPTEAPTTEASESSESTFPTNTSPEAKPSEEPTATSPTVDSPPSSTDSPEPTDGPPASPSLASSGAPSSPSGSD